MKKVNLAYYEPALYSYPIPHHHLISNPQNPGRMTLQHRPSLCLYLQVRLDPVSLRALFSAVQCFFDAARSPRPCVFSLPVSFGFGRRLGFCQTGPNAWHYTTPTVPMGSVQPVFTLQLSVVVANPRFACHSEARTIV